MLRNHIQLIRRETAAVVSTGLRAVSSKVNYCFAIYSSVCVATIYIRTLHCHEDVDKYFVTAEEIY